jgi:hypothetical protein
VKPAETAVTQQTASQTSMFPRKLDTIIWNGVFYAVRAEMV